MDCSLNYNYEVVRQFAIATVVWGVIGMAWLSYERLRPLHTPAEINPKMPAMRRIGVPYTEAEIQAAADEVTGKTEQDALVAYLQGLGTQIKTRN